MPSECVFCKIVEGKLPCYKVYEDKDFLAFLDIRPLNPGHCLVIPKKHYKWVWDVPNIDRYYQIVGKMANALKKALKTDWIASIVWGEEVPHAHVWLIPRFKNDGIEFPFKEETVKKILEKEMKEIAQKIKNSL
jgi:histidine triad (HIT) family protein